MKPTVFPSNEKIDFSKKLNVKIGIDPTSDKLHLGHLIPLLQTKKLWLEGHHVDIVLGTFTATIGDPSGRDTMRPILNEEETTENAKNIIEQVKRIFGATKFTGSGDLWQENTWPGSSVVFCKNGDWFSKISVIEMTNILSKFTTTQLLARDSFQKRIEEKNPIGMHELVVPILQGYDSVHLKTDVEIGGTDQLFNFTITRDMQRIHRQAPEICLLMPIINGTDGRKMSKSFDNCIFINDTPNDVFGKTMSISDTLMQEWWPLFVSFPIDMTEPMKMKKNLAFDITVAIWSGDEALNALNHFENVIQKKKLPDEIKEFKSGETLLDIITTVRNCSKSEAKRLLKGNGVSINGVFVGESFADSKMCEIGAVIKIGKRDFAKIV